MGQPNQIPPGGSVLDIRPGFFPLAFLLFFFKPRYSINGVPSVGRWKQNVVPVPPGRYEVVIWVSYLFFSKMGINGVVVDVPPNSAAVISWRAPFTAFGTGPIKIESVGPLHG